MAGRCAGAERKLGRGAAICGAVGGAAKCGIGRAMGAAGRAIGGGAGRAMAAGGAAGRATGAAAPPGPCLPGCADASTPIRSEQIPRKTATRLLPRGSMVAAPRQTGAPAKRNAQVKESFAGRWTRATNWLDGQITSGFQKTCQARLEKIFRFSECPIRCIIRPSPRLQEGTLRGRHGTLARVAMDAAVSGGFLAGRDVRSVRRSRVVLAPRPWRLSAPPVWGRQR